MRTLLLVAGLATSACFNFDTGVDGGADSGPNGNDPSDASVQEGLDAGSTTLLFIEGFGTSGGGWPGAWQNLGGVASATVSGGKGRLIPNVSNYSLGRMGRAVGATNVEALFTFSMADPPRQGVGFYVRQNGGYLTQSNPVGGGYAVFVEAFRGARIGLWRELFGSEEELTAVALPGIAADVEYQVRFRCVQNGGSTILYARIWALGESEPSSWTVATTDSTSSLQNVSGGIAVDAWNTATVGNGGPAPQAISVDDVQLFSVP